MQTELYSLSDVAHLLRVKPHRILYLLSSGAVPEPRLRVGGKRLWTHEEIAIVSEKLKIQLAFDMDREGRTHE
jgi:DNA-binding transcriptional MerR regulator